MKRIIASLGLLLALLIPTAAAAAPATGQITSPLVATATTGTPFTYTITVSGTGTTYAAQNLPAGLACIMPRRESSRARR